MSFVTTEPDLLTAAAGNLAVIGDAMAAQNGVAAMPTTGVVSPAADAVSNLVAAQFVVQAKHYQAIAAMAEEIHSQVVSTLQGSASAYSTAEAANTVLAG